jgi:ankyrin repeat protein
MPADSLAGDGLSLLHWAVASKDPTSMVDLLLKRKANVDIQSFDELATPLMNATERKKIDVMRLLLEKGADVNAVDKRGFTSLHRACEMGNVEAVKLLLERNATVRVEAEGGHTPLSLAKMRKEQAVIDLLETHLTP